MTITEIIQRPHSNPGRYKNQVNNLKHHAKPRTVLYRRCRKCCNFFTRERGLTIDVCSICKEHIIKTRETIREKHPKQSYRDACAFNGKLNKVDHPELFNVELIKKYGWYSPSNKRNNLHGVSWDHLFPVWKGYELGIDPKIISHPANAELVPHDTNMGRYGKQNQTITLEELYERINLWNNGNKNLPTFHKEN